jgi:predicted nucleic acid-binding protein
LIYDEPQDCETWLEHWAMGKSPTPRQWTGAYLAAFARAGSLRLVSFDGDFKGFEGLNLLRLEA